MGTTGKIGEPDLIIFLANNAVKQMTIEVCENGKYRLIVNLTWRKGDFVVKTQRGNVREWVSLDRMLKHIKNKFEGNFPPIHLELNLKKPN